ncbi:MAG: PAS sensor protein [Bacteroidales bacterium]|nr:PAS sensor protein [Bacteroidales bacterium]
MYQWAEQMDCAVTVCDKDGIIIYMNEKSRKTFEKYGNLIGKNLMDCHNPSSIAKIKELLATSGNNTYTIEKNGVKKIIYQTAWKENDIVSGLVEISIVLPEEVPNHIRK